MVIISRVHIREFRFPADYESVYTLWAGMEKGVKISRSDSMPEIQKKVARDADLFLVAEVDGRVVGSVIGGFDGRRGFVYHLAVAVPFRGQGIGSRLMDEVESRLRAKGCLKCYLLVAGDNVEAERYYEQRGWTSIDSVHLYGKELQ
jgi:ribosomal protein S18 acetylase RimI-like enzyme